MRQKYEYDAFISHAVEDKIPIANELCAKLERAGLRVWYSGKELGIGDSIEKTIEKGLNRSRYGIVILSPTYLSKNWTIREFYTLLAKEIKEHKVILPVLYNVTLDELKNKDLLMADRFAVNAERGIDFVVEKLVQEIKKPKVPEGKLAWFSRIWLVLILSLLANIAFLLKGTVFPTHGDHALVETQHSNLPDAYPVRHTLIGQIEHLARSLNACNCRENTKAQPIMTKASQRHIGSDDADTYAIAQHPSESSQPPQMPARKMTMAVVFQIETEREAKSEIPEDEIGEIFHTISQSKAKREIRLMSHSQQPGGTCPHWHEGAE